MKILIVTTELVTDHSPSGGLANSVARLGMGLGDFGHEILLLGPESHESSMAATDPKLAHTTFPDTPSSLAMIATCNLRLSLTDQDECESDTHRGKPRSSPNEKILVFFRNPLPGDN